MHGDHLAGGEAELAQPELAVHGVARGDVQPVSDDSGTTHGSRQRGRPEQFDGGLSGRDAQRRVIEPRHPAGGGGGVDEQRGPHRALGGGGAEVDALPDARQAEGLERRGDASACRVPELEVDGELGAALHVGEHEALVGFADGGVHRGAAQADAAGGAVAELEPVASRARPLGGGNGLAHRGRTERRPVRGRPVDHFLEAGVEQHVGDRAGGDRITPREAAGGSDGEAATDGGAAGKS